MLSSATLGAELHTEIKFLSDQFASLQCVILEQSETDFFCQVTERPNAAVILRKSAILNARAAWPMLKKWTPLRTLKA
jgi:hypothetical protein